jgi:hypothetical protein
MERGGKKSNKLIFKITFHLDKCNKIERYRLYHALMRGVHECRRKTAFSMSAQNTQGGNVTVLCSIHFFIFHLCKNISDNFTFVVLYHDVRVENNEMMKQNDIIGKHKYLSHMQQLRP